MDPNVVQAAVAPQSEICSYCHQLLEPHYYYCPNCGMKAHEPPLSTSLGTQLGIYAFSIVLPIICYLAITKWPGLKYLRSKDEDTHTIGVIATALLVLSSFAVFYYAYVWTEEALQQATQQVNQALGAQNAL